MSDQEKIKILVVDDQAGMRLTMKGILTRRGYDVTVAEDGAKALEAVKSMKFRIIFMDIKMPGMSGVDTFVKIKEINPKATVIMMTAFALDIIPEGISKSGVLIISSTTAFASFNNSCWGVSSAA